VDTRLSIEERRACSQKFLSVPYCCLDKRFGQRLRGLGLVTCADQLLQPDWQIILTTWASRVNLTNAAIEFRNSSQKQLTPTKNTNWYRFVAKSLCHEMSVIHRNEKAEINALLRRDDGDGDHTANRAAKVDSALQKDLRARRQAPMLFFHRRCVARDTAMGRVVDRFSKEYWTEVKVAWSLLPADGQERRQAEADSDASETDARRRRMLAKSALATMSVGSSADAPPVDPVVPKVPSITSSPISVAHHLGFFSEPTEKNRQVATFQEMTATVAQSVQASKWPMSLAECSAEVLRPGLSLKRQTQMVRSMFSHMALDNHDFGKVQYAKTCSGLCGQSASALLGRLHAFALQQLDQLFRRMKVPSVMIWCRGFAGEVCCFEQQWFVPAWCSQAGVFDFRATSIQCLPAEVDRSTVAAEYDWEDPGAGTLLVLQREAGEVLRDTSGIDPRCSSAFGEPFALCCHQMPFACTSEADWITQLVKSVCSQGGDFEHGAYITLQPVVCVDVGWDLFWTALQPTDGVDAIIVSEGERLRHVSQSSRRGCTDFLAPQRRPRKQAGKPPATDGSSDLMLMLEDVLDEAEVSQLKELVDADREADRAADMAVQSDDSDGHDSGASSDVGIVASDIGGEPLEPDVVDVSGDESDGLPASAVEGSLGVADRAPEVLTDAQIWDARKRALCERREDGIQDITLRRYGLVVQPGFVIRDRLKGEARLGKIQPCFQGSTMCATCDTHVKCRLLLSVKPGLGINLVQIATDLLAWLAAGTTTSQAQHQDLGDHAKATFYGMKLIRNLFSEYSGSTL